MAVMKSSTSAPRAGRGSSVTVAVSLGELTPGVRLRTPIYENRLDRDLLLLAAGTVVTDKALENLRSRGVTHVRVDPSEITRLTGQAASSARPCEIEKQRTTATRFALSPESLLHKVSRHRATRYDAERMSAFSNAYESALATISTLSGNLASGSLQDAPELASVSADSIVRITQDLDLFVALGVKPENAGLPEKHSTQVAMLAMSVGTLFGLRPSDLIELGVGCLIHDTGMMLLREDVRQTNRRLSNLEFLEVTKHPAITYDLLSRLRDVPTGSRMVAYQMHERCDGSGYPRGRSAAQIHPLAKIAAVADVYVALVSDRPWRPGLLPYKAMEQIIRDTRDGLFDPDVIRALLKTVSLFPIGSGVETSDGRVGTVVRTNRELFTRPVVELWRPGEPMSPEVVDLSQNHAVSITRAIKDARAIIARPGAVSLEDFWE